MTDNEIIKDLECCAKRGNCNICSRYTIPYPTCKEQLCESACHLIHYLQTEDKQLKSVTICQQNQANLPCDIGDTAYCVNGYGSNRYIEKFTVAEINIRKEGIWLTDTNGMEWLARVCHFSRESAEKELNSSKVALPVEVGDTVFLPYITDYETIEQYEVIEIGQDENGYFFRVNDEEGNKIHDYEIGTTVFLTHKEAVDKALQMIGGNKTENFLYNRFPKMI